MIGWTGRLLPFVLGAPLLALSACANVENAGAPAPPGYAAPGPAAVPPPEAASAGPPARPGAANGEPVLRQDGTASYYGEGFDGQKTASGETFDKDALTAASPSLPLGSRVKVTNKETGKSVEVRVNDRGPVAKGRAIDLSEEAAERLGMKEDGTAPVRIEARPSRQPPRLKETVAAKARAKEAQAAAR